MSEYPVDRGFSRYPQIVKRRHIPLPLEDGRNFEFTRDLCLRYAEGFRDLDIVQEMLKLRRWGRQNPDKLVPRMAMYGLITNWLKRAERDRAFKEHVVERERIDKGT